jgi:hypothetical protein
LDDALDALEASSPGLDPVIFANWTRRDPDLKALRDLPRFHDILADLDARAEAARKLVAD